MEAIAPILVNVLLAAISYCLGIILMVQGIRILSWFIKKNEIGKHKK